MDNDRINYNKIWRGLGSGDIAREAADFLIMGIPFDEGCSQRKGAAKGPDVLRASSTRNPPVTGKGDLISARVLDMGNVEFNDIQESQQEYFSRVEAKAAEIFTEKFAGEEFFPIFLGGDHSVTIPIMRGINRGYQQKIENDQYQGAAGEGEVAVVHIDTHLDLCDTLDNNPLSHGSTHRRAWELKSFGSDSTYFIGIRSYEEQELAFISDKDLSIISAEEVYRRGALQTAREIVKQVGDKPVYLTFDIDVLDPAFAPGTGTPVAGGLSTSDALIILEELAKLSPIGMDLVEFSPPWDSSEITLYAAQRIIFEMMGFIDSQAHN